MIRFQSHLLSASMCSSMTACGLDCFLSGGSFSSSAKAIDDPMGSATRATPISLNIAFPPVMWIVKIHQHAVTHVFGNETVEPSDHLCLAFVIGANHRTQIFGSSLLESA